MALYFFFKLNYLFNFNWGIKTKALIQSLVYLTDDLILWILYLTLFKV